MLYSTPCVETGHLYKTFSIVWNLSFGPRVQSILRSMTRVPMNFVKIGQVYESISYAMPSAKTWLVYNQFCTVWHVLNGTRVQSIFDSMNLLNWDTHTINLVQYDTWHMKNVYIQCCTVQHVSHGIRVPSTFHSMARVKISHLYNKFGNIWHRSKYYTCVINFLQYDTFQIITHVWAILYSMVRVKLNTFTKNFYGMTSVKWDTVWSIL